MIVNSDSFPLSLLLVTCQPQTSSLAEALMMGKWSAPHVGQAVAREQAQKLPMLAALGPEVPAHLVLLTEGVTMPSHSPDWPEHSPLLLRTGPGLYTGELGCSPGSWPLLCGQGQVPPYSPLPHPEPRWTGC